MAKKGQAIPEYVLPCKVNTVTLQGAQKRAVSEAVSGTRATEVKEMGEGSLSTFIVPFTYGEPHPWDPYEGRGVPEIGFVFWKHLMDRIHESNVNNGNANSTRGY
jgi:hypothetical protein